MEKRAIKSLGKWHWALFVLFLLEFIATIFVIVYLNNHYSSVMSVGFLISFTLIGIVNGIGKCFVRKQVSRTKTNIFYGLLVFILILGPVLLWKYFPNYSYEEAKVLLQEKIQTTLDDKIERESLILLEDSGNPFINRAYFFILNVDGNELEYAVSPVSGNVSELKE